MTVKFKKKTHFIWIFKNIFLPLFRNQIYLYDMAAYISFATVIFTSKSEGERDLSSVTVYIGPTSGCTVSHAFEFLYKSPLIKANLRDSNILSVTFSYSEL